VTWSIDASPTGGSALEIYGSAGSDKISVDTQRSGSTANVTVIAGKFRRTFFGMSQISVNGNDGNDVVTLTGDNMSAAYLPVFIIGGNGDDVLAVSDFNGNVNLVGGDGNDILTAKNALRKTDSPTKSNTSSRILLGGAGDDILVGSIGDDRLDGEAGNDVVYGLAGNDELLGGTGINVLNGGDGDDLFLVLPTNGLFPDDTTNVGGYDVIDGGSGNDTVVSYFNPNITPVFGTIEIDNVETNLVLAIG
jgi:Ca2+-binding RTX toxin-like protein